MPANPSMKNGFGLSTLTRAIASLGLLLLARTCPAQDLTRESLAGEEAAANRARAALSRRYNIRWGSGGLSLQAGVRGEYVDNVFLSYADKRDDFILVPELDIGAFFPVGELNTFGLNLGVAYYQYFKNTELNTGTPIVNPDSRLEFNIYSGDFAFQLTESFSYQQTPFYESGAQFYNVYDTGLFARYYNLAGASMTWDLQNLVVTAGYHHENLWSEESIREYINRASELFDAKAMFVTSPKASVGLEAGGSLNAYDHTPWNDNWRARVGPAIQLKPSQFVTARLGGGYERIAYEPQWQSYLGTSGWDTYYAYCEIEHEINRFFNHRLNVYHDNQSGINAANLAGTHVRYYLIWNARPDLTVSPYAGVHFYEESYGPGAATALYHETFTYVDAGWAVDYQYNQHWRANLNWNYRLKDSDIQLYGYSQNVVRLELTYRF